MTPRNTIRLAIIASLILFGMDGFLCAYKVLPKIDRGTRLGKLSGKRIMAFQWELQRLAAKPDVISCFQRFGNSTRLVYKDPSKLPYSILPPLN
jgi:hypothetical protein